jgi:hypothetical protein
VGYCGHVNTLTHPPERRPTSPTSELRHQLRSPDVLIPTVHHRQSPEHHRRPPSIIRRRSPSASDDEADSIGHRVPSRTGPHAGGVPTVHSSHHREPSIRDDDGRRIHRTPSVTEHDDGRPRQRAPSAMDADRWSHHRSPSARDDEADPREHRAPPQALSRTGSRAGGMPAVVQEGDGRPESEMVHHVRPPDHDPDVHFDPTTTEFDEALNRRHERLDEAERELNQVVQGAHEAEDRRETEFRQNEEEREQVFLRNEERRDAEARQRGDAIFAELEERARSVPPLPVPPPPGSGDNSSFIESVHTASREAASRHASDILETVQLEREQFARERESLASEREQERAEFAAERARMDEEREQRVHDLQEELARVRGELDSERQLRQTENEERAAANERDEGVRAQLGDITQLVSEQRDECTRKRELMDQRWEEKQGRRAEKDAQFHELKDMVSRLIQDREADRIQEEERRLQEEGKPDIQVVLDELTRQNNEMREALRVLSEGMSWACF